jgi:hypothetical protein
LSEPTKRRLRERTNRDEHRPPEKREALRRPPRAMSMLMQGELLWRFGKAEDPEIDED